MKRVLYIVYYWPPCGGISVIRDLKFVKYFRDFGWEPVVYAPENANYPVLDETLVKEIPVGIEVIKTPILEPFGIFNILKGRKKDEFVRDVFLVSDKKQGIAHKLGIWVRGNFFIPDARMLWIKPSIRYLRKYLKTHQIDAIISDGPPHSLHLIANVLHKEFGIPWIADFEDPWTQIDYFEKFMLSDFAREKHKRLEQDVLKNADRVTIVSPAWSKDLADLGSRPVDFIPCGYDEDDFKDKSGKQSNKFIISHYGTFGSDRNPEKLWAVLADLTRELSGFKEDLLIDLAGIVDHSIFRSIETAGIRDYLRFTPFFQRKQVIQGMLDSTVLLLLLNKGFGDYNVKGRIPAKLFEYLGSRRQIMVIGTEDSDVAGIVADAKAGLTMDYDKDEVLKTTITAFYEAWKAGKQLYIPQNIEKYAFRNLTGEMADLLDEITK